MTAETPANILLVDDRPENLLAMESILADLGQNLIRATSGREALRFLLDNDVALILLDVQMPGLDGFELAELIRERDRTERTPIIFVSANRTEPYIFKGYSLGAVDYIAKPFEPEILRSKVKFFTELFQQNRQIKRQAELLEKANGELDSLNGELEARVKRRTTQLETANRELENEIAIRKQAEARMATEHAITRTLADASSLEAAASAILKAFVENLHADICLLWLLDENGGKLNCKQTAVASTDDFSVFINESRRTDLTKSVGLPGKVWETRKPVWIQSTIKETNFPRARFAATVGLTSGIGFPIIIGREFFGVIEFYTRQSLPYDQPLLNMMSAIGSEIGQFIQRKRAETERENLLKREKSLREQAEKASRLKDEFLATVSHELRTPLNAILGWGQILLAGKLDEAEHTRALETIHRNAKSQAQLIDDLLDTSRLITGNLRLSLSPTPVIPVIEAALDVVRPAAEAKNITLSATYNSTAETITCDAQRLQQMVWNLLTNAVKFTPRDGRVNVRLEDAGEKIQIIISDSGQGIEPDFLPYVFDRFRQADSSSTRRHGGLGLGLAIVRHLTDLHGGTISALSEGSGKGSTFTLSLPATLAKTAEESVAPPPNGHYNEMQNGSLTLDGVRILIVDDDEDTREMLAFVLSHWGAQTQASASVAEAFDALSKWQPDVLLTDISMPGEDGYALINRLRSKAIEDGGGIPAIALTAHARPEDTEHAITAGFQLHLSKPVDTQQLAEAIIHITKKTV